MKKYLPISLLIFNLLVLNILVGYLFYHNIYKLPLSAISTPTPLVTDNCTDTCMSYVDEKIGALVIPTVKPQSTQKPVASTPKTKTRSISYFQVPGSGSTLSQSWTDVAGSDFYFDPAEHPGLTDVRFEVNMKLLNANGQAAIRLYDVTHTMGVINSEVFTSSQTSVLVTSGAINFWSGRNQYRVQVKSLTADTAVFESGRLKMTLEN